MSARVVGDVSGLPTYGFGPKTLIWWGTVGFMLIEGTGFALACGAYFYLMGRVPHWPPASPPPKLIWGTLFTVVLLLSEIPNVWLNRKAHAMQLQACKVGLVVIIVFGAVLLALRGLEFTTLNERWDHNAYGSIIWTLVFLHATHVATDWYDTDVLAAAVFTHKVDGRRFSDISDNAMYWHFVVATWLPIYVLVYWVPRWVG